MPWWRRGYVAVGVFVDGQALHREGESDLVGRLGDEVPVGDGGGAWRASGDDAIKEFARGAIALAAWRAGGVLGKVLGEIGGDVVRLFDGADVNDRSAGEGVPVGGYPALRDEGGA